MGYIILNERLFSGCPEVNKMLILPSIETILLILKVSELIFPHHVSFVVNDYTNLTSNWLQVITTVQIAPVSFITCER